MPDPTPDTRETLDPARIERAARAAAEAMGHEMEMDTAECPDADGTLGCQCPGGHQPEEGCADCASPGWPCAQAYAVARAVLAEVGQAEPPEPEYFVCGFCGHVMNMAHCGFASASEGDEEVYLCHANDHDCYYRWTVLHERPSAAQVPVSPPEPARLLRDPTDLDADEAEPQPIVVHLGPIGFGQRTQCCGLDPLTQLPIHAFYTDNPKAANCYPPEPPVSPGHRRGDGEPAEIPELWWSPTLARINRNGLVQRENVWGDAVRLVPAQPSDEVQAPTRPDGDAALELLRELLAAINDEYADDMTPLWDRARALLSGPPLPGQETP